MNVIIIICTYNFCIVLFIHLRLYKLQKTIFYCSISILFCFSAVILSNQIKGQYIIGWKEY